MPIKPALRIGSTVRGRLWIVRLVVLLCLFLPATALASPSNPDHVGPDTCAQCHPAQATTWGDSSHAHAEVSLAQGGVTCEVCHGTYVADHPQSDVMQLDASCCQDCHSATYGQWHETAHAGAGVQCASCHVPHTQETRLAGEELCASCHREVVDDWTHHNADVHCADCHLTASSPPATSSDVRVMSGHTLPDHTFKPAAEACADCHAQSIHDETFTEALALVDCAQMPTMTEHARELAHELEDAKQTNRSLQAMSVVSLGFGLGTGGVLGAIFVLVVGYVSQRSASK